MTDVFTNKMKALEKAFQTELEFDDAHAAFLVDDVVFDFAFNEATGMLLLYAVLGSIELLSEAQRNAIYAQALKAQFCFVDCGGFAFGVDPDETMINLQAQWKLEAVEDMEFVASVEAFVNMAHAWAKTLAKQAEDGAPEARNSAPAEGGLLGEGFGMMV